MEKQAWGVATLAGSEVFDSTGERLGVLVDVLPSGGNDVWVIRQGPPGSREVLIPALQSVVREVDPANKKIIVSMPSGLREIYEEEKK